MTRLLLAVFAALASSAALAEPIPSAGSCASSPSANRQLVIDFYTQVLVNKQVRAGFERYVSPGFVEHKPDVAGGGREQVIRFLDSMIKEMPGASWTILRTVSDGDLVALHARFSPAPGTPDFAIADFFRLKDCRIVEHWDVVGPPPKSAANPNMRF